jgi:hypothetical protein
MFEQDHMETNMSSTIGEPFITFAYLSFLTSSVCGWEALELLQWWLDCMGSNSGNYQG